MEIKYINTNHASNLFMDLPTKSRNSIAKSFPSVLFYSVQGE